MPIVNGRHVPLKPTGVPPNGGEWVDEDWNSDVLCPTPGYNVHRDAIRFSAPEEFTQTLDQVTAECHIKCGVAEAGNDIDVIGHSGTWSRSLMTGWSLEVSLLGDVGNKIAKIAAGIAATYTEQKETTVTLNWAFPHCTVARHWRVYRQPILRVVQRHTGKVYRYFKDRDGNILEGFVRRDGKILRNETAPFASFRGHHVFKRVQYRLGRASHADAPCGQQMTGFPLETALRAPATRESLPNAITDFALYAADDVAAMVPRFAAQAQMSEKALFALGVVLRGDAAMVKRLSAEIEVSPFGELIDETDNFTWILQNRHVLEAMPEGHKKAARAVLREMGVDG